MLLIYAVAGVHRSGDSRRRLLKQRAKRKSALYQASCLSNALIHHLSNIGREAPPLTSDIISPPFRCRQTSFSISAASFAPVSFSHSLALSFTISGMKPQAPELPHPTPLQPHYLPLLATRAIISYVLLVKNLPRPLGQ